MGVYSYTIIRSIRSNYRGMFEDNYWFLVRDANMSSRFSRRHGSLVVY